MDSKFNDKRLRFFLGDVRDAERLNRAFEDVDFVFHAAALKHVDKVEYNPFEAIKTNVIGSQNVIDASLHQNIEKAICVGTDKAVSPFNTYGATKLLMEKLFVTANNYVNPKKHRTKFIALRYGNVLGSSGSVIPKFIEQISTNKTITITDPNMTRFSITMDEALDFILSAAKFGSGSEIFIPKIKAYSIMDVKDALFDLLQKTDEKISGIRPGEKLHEILINSDEMKYTWEVDNLYVILNPLQKLNKEKRKYPNMKKIKTFQTYSSDTVNKLSKTELKKLIKKSGLV
jgi:UDP-N-acetylglucosamine 4,6-dehydratase/UDP-glucose 4-epimerase